MQRDAPSSFTPPEFSDYDDLPVSYESKYFCVIRWTLCLHIRRDATDDDDDSAAGEFNNSAGHDYRHFTFIHVNRLCDLNREDLPRGLVPFQEVQVFKSLASLPARLHLLLLFFPQDVHDWSGLRLKVEVPRTKLVCGDMLVVRVHADNRGKGPASITCNLHSK